MSKKQDNNQVSQGTALPSDTAMPEIEGLAPEVAEAMERRIAEEQAAEVAAVEAAVTAAAGGEAARKAQQEAERLAAREGAAMAVGFMEMIVKGGAPYVSIDEASKERVTDKLGAVLQKHGTGLPAWLAPYREEVELFVAMGGVGFGVYMQVVAHRQQMEAEAEAERQRQEQAKRRQQGQGIDLATA